MREATNQTVTEFADILGDARSTVYRALERLPNGAGPSGSRTLQHYTSAANDARLVEVLAIHDLAIARQRTKEIQRG